MWGVETTAVLMTRQRNLNQIGEIRSLVRSRETKKKERPQSDRGRRGYERRNHTLPSSVLSRSGPRGSLTEKVRRDVLKSRSWGFIRNYRRRQCGRKRGKREERGLRHLMQLVSSNVKKKQKKKKTSPSSKTEQQLQTHKKMHKQTSQRKKQKHNLHTQKNLPRLVST